MIKHLLSPHVSSSKYTFAAYENVKFTTSANIPTENRNVALLL